MDVDIIKQEYTHAIEAYTVGDNTKLSDWFKKHEYLKLAELSSIAGINYSSLRKLRTKVGIIKGTHRVNHKTPKKVWGITLKDGWETDKEYLSNIARIYPVSAISKVTGIHYRKLIKLFKSLGIKRESKHRFRNYDWCYKHYIEKNIKPHDCAKLANISISTFYAWLAEFKIPLKTSKIPTWLRKFIHNIEQYTKRITIIGKYIQITYKDNCTEKYNYTINSGPRSITQQDSEVGKIPLVYHQFGTNIDGVSDYKHYAINKESYRLASKFGKKISLHILLHKIRSTKWAGLYYPHEYLVNDLNNLKSFDENDLIEPDGFKSPLYSAIKPGKAISDHYFYSEQKKYLVNSLGNKYYGTPTRNYKLLEYIAGSSGYEISTGGLFRIIEDSRPHLSRFIEQQYPGSMSNYVNPKIYSAIFKKLGIKSILDMYPNFGIRSLAASLTNVKYYLLPSQQFSDAIDLDYDKFIGLDWEYYSDQQVDAIICDRDHRLSDLNLALTHRSRCKAIILFVTRGDFAEWHKIYKPSAVIRINMVNYYNSKDRCGYYFVL